MTLYVIQECEGGIPETPQVFTDKETADIEWLHYFGRGYFYTPQNDRLTREEAADTGYLSQDVEGDLEVRYWTVESSDE